jgi:hypothetical protein
MSKQFTLEYEEYPERYGFRFELFYIAHDEYTGNPYTWELHSFSAKPTKRQIRKCKSKFYNRINGIGI